MILAVLALLLAASICRFIDVIMIALRCWYYLFTQFSTHAFFTTNYRYSTNKICKEISLLLVSHIELYVLVYISKLVWTYFWICRILT